jgi:exodeoxyribonuclease VII large subunit
MNERVQTVSELTRDIQVILEESFSFVTVQGEISNFKYHSSGHRYFTLKDERAQISCTLWRGKPVNFQLADGMKVVVTGSLTLYPPRGQYQIECISIAPLGQGDLYLAYEALKKKLEEKGYFAPERKKPIPEKAMRIGVSTSATGAAVKDIISTIERRFPLATVYFRPTLVQGEGSAEDIVRAILDFQKTNVDVIIVGRGGGSIEDLWSYNTELVADAIYKSTIPIISAVGHETDFTIADFVADMRAATPTAAAELVTHVTISEFEEIIETSEEFLITNIIESIRDYRERVKEMSAPSVLRRLRDRIRTNMQLVDDYETRTTQGMKRAFINMNQKLQSLESHCKSLYPLSPLNKGFAILESEGKIITKDETLGNYILVDIVRSREKASATINKVIPTVQKLKIKI